MDYQRITNSYMSNSVLGNITANRDLLVELQEKIASGKEFKRASEDVFSAMTVINSNSSLNKIETYLKNIDMARSEIETADSIILTAIDSIQRARELTIQSLNATSGSDEKKLIGAEIEQLIEQIKSLGNTQLGSKYLFGGQNTSTPPFTDGINPGEVQYNGSGDGSAERQVEIAKGVTVTVNVAGDEVFGYYYTGDHDDNPLTPDTTEGQGLLYTMITLAEELKGGQDEAVIRQRLDDLDNDLDGLLEIQSSLGGLLERVEVTENIHLDNEISITDTKSKAQDVDFAKAISDLSFQESALQASLKVGSAIIQPSLLNYLR